LILLDLHQRIWYNTKGLLAPDPNRAPADPKENLVDQKPSALQQFLAAYAEHTAASNIPALVAQFADTFLVAGPSGSQCVHSADFARALPRRVELFASLGCQPAELISTEESPLATRYVLARTMWRFTFTRPEKAAESIDSESIFLIDTGSDAFRILLYLTPHDIMDTLRQRGITA